MQLPTPVTYYMPDPEYNAHPNSTPTPDELKAQGYTMIGTYMHTGAHAPDVGYTCAPTRVGFNSIQRVRIAAAGVEGRWNKHAWWRVEIWAKPDPNRQFKTC